VHEEARAGLTLLKCTINGEDARNRQSKKNSCLCGISAIWWHAMLCTWHTGGDKKISKHRCCMVHKSQCASRRAKQVHGNGQIWCYRVVSRQFCKRITSRSLPPCCMPACDVSANRAVVFKFRPIREQQWKRLRSVGQAPWEWWILHLRYGGNRTHAGANPNLIRSATLTIRPTEYIRLVLNVPITCDGNVRYQPYILGWSNN